MDQLTRLFPLLAVLAAVAAYLAPGLFAPFAWAIVPLLVVIMFCMGLTLTVDDFKRVAQRPAAVGLGVLLQYTIMPVAAFLIGLALSMPAELLAGLVLLGSSPGGTASNVICYLARANVALSVTLTLTSTLVAIVVTPVVTWLLLDQYVPVDVVGMLSSMVQIVLVPVMLGVAINHLFGRRIEKMKPVLPVAAIAAILAAIAIIVALNRAQLANAALTVAAAVVLHNLLGFAGGSHSALARLRPADLPHAQHRGRHAELRPERCVGAQVFLAAGGAAGRHVQRLAQYRRRGARRLLVVAAGGAS